MAQQDDSKIPMTPSGHRALLEEVKHLKSVARPKIIEEIAAARALGDLSENAEYHAAREQHGQIEARVQLLETHIRRAQIIDVATLSGDTIKFGATVHLVDEESDVEVTYQLVGEFEADAKQGRISIGSPLARALIGKKAGDSAQVNLPTGERFYEIIKITYK